MSELMKHIQHDNESKIYPSVECVLSRYWYQKDCKQNLLFIFHCFSRFKKIWILLFLVGTNKVY
jgi:hypothetical protein